MTDQVKLPLDLTAYSECYFSAYSADTSVTPSVIGTVAGVMIVVKVDHLLYLPNEHILFTQSANYTKEQTTEQ